jgi:hypothetical protein
MRVASQTGLGRTRHNLPGPLDGTIGAVDRLYFRDLNEVLRGKKVFLLPQLFPYESRLNRSKRTRELLIGRALIDVLVSA